MSLPKYFQVAKLTGQTGHIAELLKLCAVTRFFLVADATKLWTQRRVRADFFQYCLLAQQHGRSAVVVLAEVMQVLLRTEV